QANGSWSSWYSLGGVLAGGPWTSYMWHGGIIVDVWDPTTSGTASSRRHQTAAGVTGCSHRSRDARRPAARHVNTVNPVLLAALSALTAVRRHTPEVAQFAVTRTPEIVWPGAPAS